MAVDGSLHGPTLQARFARDPLPRSVQEPILRARIRGLKADVHGLDHGDTEGMIEALELTKHIGDAKIVEDVSFRCEPGTVTGFLGPNGAGKSTTMRMLVGLARPTSGSSLVCDLPYGKLPNPGRQVGILLDATAQPAARTGRETLVQGAMAMGIDAPDIAALLDRVGLDRSASRKQVGQYSLGMRQRLGLAHALLGRPAGADPRRTGERARSRGHRAGCERSCATSRTAAARCCSRRTCSTRCRRPPTSSSFIGGGRIVAAGRPEELLDMTSTVVRSSDDVALAVALAAAGLEPRTTPEGDVLVAAPADEIGRIALDADLALHHLAAVGDAGLEQLFFDLTTTAHRAGAPA